VNLTALERRLSRGGFIAARDEARELLEAASGDEFMLDALLKRRETGEPLAWIVGRTRFCDIDVLIHPGVFIPRPHTEHIAHCANHVLSDSGRAVDVCTGSGAVAIALMHRHPRARVIGTDIDRHAVRCARANAVDARFGDLFQPVPAAWRGRVDLVTAVVPYVPTPQLRFLQRDTFSFETSRAYDGGRDGTDVLSRVISEAARVLRPGGNLVCELGGDQLSVISRLLERCGYINVRAIRDEEGDLRGFAATAAT
jgi:release factor glutamine methyltransferase